MCQTECLILPTEKLKNIIEEYDKDIFIKTNSGSLALKFKDLKKIIRDSTFNESGSYIHELLSGCEIILPSPQQEPRNPELEERVQKLKAEHANKEYQKMVENIGIRSERQSSVKNDIRSVNAQLAVVINFVLTVGGSFIFTYKAVEYSLPEPNIPAQVLLGVLTATVVAIADLYFLIRDL